MSAPVDAVQSAIDDARALLDMLLTSDWRDIHVISGETEVFIAREGGRPNPMRQAPAVTAPPSAATTTDEEHLVTAPHVATIVETVSVGTQVESGARLATIRVLDTEEMVSAPHAGMVTAIHAEAGALVEFEAPILSLGASGR